MENLQNVCFIDMSCFFGEVYVIFSTLLTVSPVFFVFYDHYLIMAMEADGFAVLSGGERRDAALYPV